MAIYIVTHGEKKKGPNPRMTKKGFEQIGKIKSIIPADPVMVISGTGRRHVEVAKTLNLKIDRFTSVMGCADSSEIIDGQKKIRLPDGTVLEPSIYTTLKDMSPAVKQFISKLPDGTIICAGRPLLKMLSYAEPKSGSVYKVNGVNGCITELVATGEVEEVSA